MTGKVGLLFVKQLSVRWNIFLSLLSVVHNSGNENRKTNSYTFNPIQISWSCKVTNNQNLKIPWVMNIMKSSAMCNSWCSCGCSVYI